MKVPFRCPICGGSRIVPNGFYDNTSGDWSRTSATPEPCRSCEGSGIIIVEQEVEIFPIEFTNI